MIVILQLFMPACSVLLLLLLLSRKKMSKVFVSSFEIWVGCAQRAAVRVSGVSYVGVEGWENYIRLFLSVQDRGLGRFPVIDLLTGQRKMNTEKMKTVA